MASTKDAERMPSRVVVYRRERVLEGFLKIDRLTVSYERYDGTMSDPVERMLMERGDAVAVLPYEEAGDRVVLVQQFRYPVHDREGSGWLWEAIAGMVDGEPASVARREAEEEAGLSLEALNHVCTVYASPGASTERIHVYLAPLRQLGQLRAMGGLHEEGEDIRIATFGLRDALDMVREGRITDAKTIIALQHLALLRAVEPTSRHDGPR